MTYEDRNPVWLLAGIEADSPEGKVIRWGEPELLLYSDDPMIRISYPDLVEENGRYFVTETEKNKARRHEIPAEFLAKMWRRRGNRRAGGGGARLARGGVPLPAVPRPELRGGQPPVRPHPERLCAPLRA